MPLPQQICETMESRVETSTALPHSVCIKNCKAQILSSGSGPEELRLKNDNFHNALCHSVCNIRTGSALHNVHSCSPERHEQHILCVGRQLWADLHPLKPLWAAPSSDADVHVVQLGSSRASSGSCNARSHIRLQQLPNIPCGGKRVARACGCRQ